MCITSIGDYGQIYVELHRLAVMDAIDRRHVPTISYGLHRSEVTRESGDLQDPYSVAVGRVAAIVWRTP